MMFGDDNEKAEKKPKMKWRTTFVIDSECDPREWSLLNFYWARENGEAVIVKDRTTRKRK